MSVLQFQLVSAFKIKHVYIESRCLVSNIVYVRPYFGGNDPNLTNIFQTTTRCDL